MSSLTQGTTNGGALEFASGKYVCFRILPEEGLGLRATAPPARVTESECPVFPRTLKAKQRKCAAVRVSSQGPRPAMRLLCTALRV
eukprot:scaffold3851_cov66-Phaeocystis_antarctica.AAC.7